MKKEDFIKSFTNVEPSEEAKQKMFQNITQHNETRNRNYSFKMMKVIVPVFMITLVLFIGLFMGDRLSNNELENIGEDDGSRVDTDLAGRAPEDAVAILKDQFQIGNRHYKIKR